MTVREPTAYDRRVVASLPALDPQRARDLALIFLGAAVTRQRAS